MNELIKVNNLSLGYDKKVVLKNISFSVLENDFLCVVGENGSGKSTLIKGLLGLIKPMKGSIKYNNLKQTFIGYTSQDTSVDKNFPALVSEIVLSGRLNQKKINCFYNNEDFEKLDEVLKRLKIYGLKNKSFSSLSGGQRQKVLLARAMMATTKLLILDEPSNNLDYDFKKELYKILEELNEKGVTIIMITHDLDHSNLIGNKILALRSDDYFFGSVLEYVEVLHHGK